MTVRRKPSLTGLSKSEFQVSLGPGPILGNRRSSLGRNLMTTPPPELHTAAEHSQWSLDFNPQPGFQHPTVKDAESVGEIQSVMEGLQSQLMMLNGTTEAQDLGRQSGNWDEGKPGQTIFRKSQLPNAAVGRCRTFLMETVTKPNMSAISPVAMGSALGELACYLLCLTVFELFDPLRALHKAIRAS